MHQRMHMDYVLPAVCIWNRPTNLFAHTLCEQKVNRKEPLAYFHGENILNQYHLSELAIGFQENVNSRAPDPLPHKKRS